MFPISNGDSSFFLNRILHLKNYITLEFEYVVIGALDLFIQTSTFFVGVMDKIMNSGVLLILSYNVINVTWFARVVEIGEVLTVVIVSPDNFLNIYVNANIDFIFFGNPYVIYNIDEKSCVVVVYIRNNHFNLVL